MTINICIFLSGGRKTTSRAGESEEEHGALTVRAGEARQGGPGDFRERAEGGRQTTQNTGDQGSREKG